VVAHPHPAARPGAEARFEVADIFRRHGADYLRAHLVTPTQGKALRSAMVCRTRALGGHVDVCKICGDRTPSYNSCRNRHCPTCQGSQAMRWIAERVERLVPTHHFHVVFTLPSELRPVALANPKVVYDLLFSAASDTLLELAASKWKAQPGITAVLHTWERQMGLHPHLHCVITGGGLSEDGRRWVSCRKNFLFPVKVLSKLFRGKLIDGLVRARTAGKLRFVGTSAALANPVAWEALRSQMYQAPFVVYAKRPFGGPEQVLRYLGRYTHRVAIGSSRLLSVTDEAIVFKTRGDRTCRVRPEEFIRRFLLHTLPDRFRKIRHFGLLSPANVSTRLVGAQQLVSGLNRRRRRAGPVVAPAGAPEPRVCTGCGGALVREVIHRARPPPPPAHPDHA
jgi:hypothetical protein